MDLLIVDNLAIDAQHATLGTRGDDSRVPQAMRHPLAAMMDERVFRTFQHSEAAHRDDGELIQHDAFERAQRIASGSLSTDDQLWLKKAFTAFLAAGGALSLERCLGLPRKDGSLRRACRDYWLRRAWKSLNGNPSPWRRSEKLAAAIRDFRSRHWVHWRAMDAPPSYASPLETALFHAFRSSERIPSTAMQLHNIAYHRRHS